MERADIVLNPCEIEDSVLYLCKNEGCILFFFFLVAYKVFQGHFRFKMAIG